jgi:hypothetical protein
MTIIAIVVAALCLGAAFGFCRREIVAMGREVAVADPSYYTAMTIFVGAVIGILYPGGLEAVLAAQAVFVVIAALGYVAVRRRRRAA